MLQRAWQKERKGLLCYMLQHDWFTGDTVTKSPGKETFILWGHWLLQNVNQHQNSRFKTHIKKRWIMMLRSHLERNPAEFVEMKIWASSKSLPGFGRALSDSHIQIGRLLHLAYIFRTEVGPSPSDLWRTLARCGSNALPLCWISGLPQAVNAISSARQTRWGGPRLNACSMGNFIFLSGRQASW